MFLQFGAMQVFGDSLMGGGLAGKDEVAAGIVDGSDDRLAGKQIVAEIDRLKMGEASAMPGQPAFRSVALQSCFSAPSCGAMNSGGRGRTCLWPGATMLAPRKAWKYLCRRPRAGASNTARI